MKLSIRLCVLFLFSIITAQAQYNPSKIFVSNFYNHKGDDFRSASGSPSEDYWQNEADYKIEASFDVAKHLLKGTVTIDYTNNSPDQLHFLWLQMDQNTTRPDARANQMRNPESTQGKNTGYQLEKVVINRGDHKLDASYKVYGTRMQIRLQKPVEPGESIQLYIPYSYVLQQQGGGGRSGYMKTEEGMVFEFSYWYPRMCVYDDYQGWNTLPFIGGGEMYLDYGDIDYKLTVPANQVVVGSGYLVNQDEILNNRTLKRLQKAMQSDKPVMIRKANELDKPVTKGNSKTVTWHFHMNHTRDVAWAMSPAYIWDAARINLPSGKTALAQSVYPKGSLEEGRAWARSTEMLKASVEFFSNFVLEYPYKTSSSVAGSVGGMEFPGFVFNSWRAKPYSMYLLASHEIGHTWFPMIVGSNERRFPFMDEGFNTFIDVYAQADFNKGEFAPKRDGEYAPGGGNPADEIIPVIAANQGGATLMTPPDWMNYKHVHPLAYFKTAFGLVMLREVVLGPDRFDFAFQQYAKDWAFKHPHPEDFFRSMDNATGEDLTWFWNGWFYHNWQLDQAVKNVTYIKDKPANGALITVTNNKQMVMPILVSVVEENGKTHQFKVPVDVWQKGAETKFSVNSTSKIKKVTLDAQHQLPDINRSNNVWKR